MFEEWGEETGRTSADAFIPGLRHRIHCSSIPFTLVAFHEKEPVGTASLFIHDMDDHRHLSPWLAAVYVNPGYRHRKIGRRLCEEVTRRAKSLGVESVYLFTPDRAAFYGHMGWKPIEKTTYRNRAVTIMRRSLD
jgi:N-acetylglutamate synthase-like GNAT family acetyltransferase